MKKFILMLSLIFSLSTYSQKSEAGVSIFALGAGADLAMDMAEMDGFLMGLGLWAGVITIVTGAIIGGVKAIHNPAAGLHTFKVCVVLDAENKIPTTNLNQYFMKRYDFIDNQATTLNIAKAIENEYKEGMDEVHLSQAKIQELLDGSDLTNEQYDLIVQDLI